MTMYCQKIKFPAHSRDSSEVKSQDFCPAVFSLSPALGGVGIQMTFTSTGITPTVGINALNVFQEFRPYP